MKVCGPAGACQRSFSSAGSLLLSHNQSAALTCLAPHVQHPLGPSSAGWYPVKHLTDDCHVQRNVTVTVSQVVFERMQTNSTSDGC